MKTNSYFKKIVLFIIELIITFFAFFLISKLFFEFIPSYFSSGDPYELDFIYEAIVSAPVLICTVIWVCTSRIIRAIKSNKQSENKDEDD